VIISQTTKNLAVKLILMDLYYCGEEDDVYIFLIGPSKQIPEIPYPRNSAWLPRGLRVNLR
jgi:hypothetical protein